MAPCARCVHVRLRHRTVLLSQPGAFRVQVLRASQVSRAWNSAAWDKQLWQTLCSSTLSAFGSEVGWARVRTRSALPDVEAASPQQQCGCEWAAAWRVAYEQRRNWRSGAGDGAGRAATVGSNMLGTPPRLHRAISRARQHPSAQPSTLSALSPRGIRRATGARTTNRPLITMHD